MLYNIRYFITESIFKIRFFVLEIRRKKYTESKIKYYALIKKHFFCYITNRRFNLIYLYRAVDIMRVAGNRRLEVASSIDYIID